jgi:hypothetical protein
MDLVFNERCQYPVHNFMGFNQIPDYILSQIRCVSIRTIITIINLRIWCGQVGWDSEPSYWWRRKVDIPSFHLRFYPVLILSVLEFFLFFKDFIC